MNYIIFGPNISDEEFDKKLEEDKNRLEKIRKDSEEVAKAARKLLGLPEK